MFGLVIRIPSLVSGYWWIQNDVNSRANSEKTSDFRKGHQIEFIQVFLQPKNSTYVHPIDFNASTRRIENFEVSCRVAVRGWSTSMDERNQRGGNQDHCHQGSKTMPKGTDSKADPDHFSLLDSAEGINQIDIIKLGLCVLSIAIQQLLSDETGDDRSMVIKNKKRKVIFREKR